MIEQNARIERAGETRDRILATAERLFAEHGVYAVSNRQISDAAGQGNTAAVGYHFGSKAELVRAITRKHAAEVERSRTRMLAEITGATEVRAWVSCLVLPLTDHLAELGSPTWYARFNAQVMTDPALHEIVTQESLEAPALTETLAGLRRCVSTLPSEVRGERGDMARQLLVHMVAERERALAEDIPTPRASWYAAASGLVDAMTGLWLAPVSDE